MTRLASFYANRDRLESFDMLGLDHQALGLGNWLRRQVLQWEKQLFDGRAVERVCLQTRLDQWPQFADTQWVAARINGYFFSSVASLCNFCEPLKPLHYNKGAFSIFTRQIHLQFSSLSTNLQLSLLFLLLFSLLIFKIQRSISKWTDSSRLPDDAFFTSLLIRSSRPSTCRQSMTGGRPLQHSSSMKQPNCQLNTFFSITGWHYLLEVGKILVKYLRFGTKHSAIKTHTSPASV